MRERLIIRHNNLLSDIVDALVSDGYIIIPNALSPQLAQDLQKFAQNITNFKKAGISSTSKLHLDATKRRDAISWLNKDDACQSEFLNFTQELQKQLNQELYLGINYYESHFAIYEKGDFYEKHLDAFKGSKNRIVTTVYYLNDAWDAKNGGELVIYNTKNEAIKKVIPHANTLIVFLSDKFPHEVLPAKKRRFSIAGWFRIDK